MEPGWYLVGGWADLVPELQREAWFGTPGQDYDDDGDDEYDGDGDGGFLAINDQVVKWSANIKYTHIHANSNPF